MPFLFKILNFCHYFYLLFILSKIEILNQVYLTLEEKKGLISLQKNSSPRNDHAFLDKLQLRHIFKKAFKNHSWLFIEILFHSF